MQISLTIPATVDRLGPYREYYASYVLSYAGAPEGQGRLWAAFATTPRENFVGAGPWEVFTPHGYIVSPTADPAFLYQDITVCLREQGDVNNGRPSVHAACLNALRIQTGETIVHVGSGTGYYSALLAVMTGSGGVVHAYEIVPELAERARQNLQPYVNVTLHARSGSEGPIPQCDVLYVSAGATDPIDVWLDALRIGGRLLFPLTPDDALGGMLLVTRTAADEYAARFIYRVTFIPCIGARDEDAARRLRAAFDRGDHDTVRFLRRGAPPASGAWCWGKGWWLGADDTR